MMYNSLRCIMTKRSLSSTWFFVGSLLLISGVVATAAGLVNPGPSGETVVLGGPHPDIVWGLLLLALGAYSCKRSESKNID